MHPLADRAHSGPSRFAVALLLAALALRALVPEGFMPANGEFVELCTEHGLQRMLVDTGSGEVLGTEDETATPTCPWSVMLTTLAPTSLAAAPAFLFTARETAPRLLQPRAAPDRPRLPPARAPPRLS